MTKIQVEVGDALVKVMMKSGGVKLGHWMGHAGCFLMMGCHEKSVKTVASQGRIFYYVFMSYLICLILAGFVWCCCCRCRCPGRQPQSQNRRGESEDYKAADDDNSQIDIAV